MQEGEKSTTLGPCPISMAAVHTAAIIASKSTGAPLQSAPRIVHPSTTTSTLVSANQFELHLNPSKNESQQSIKQLYKRPQSKTTQETAATTNSKQLVITDTSKNNMILRSGKWTAEEEHYANILIELFEEGRVDEFEDNDINNKNDKSEEEKHPPIFKITNGMTLRAYLSRKLFCSPMRISKKFAGKGIGKLVYMSQSPGAYQQRWQSSSNSIKNLDFAKGAPLRSATHCDGWHRLKQAESNFLRIAFPGYDSLSVNASRSKTKAPFAATRTPKNQDSSVKVIGIPSTNSASAGIMSKSQPSRSSCDSLQIRPTLAANKNSNQYSIRVPVSTRHSLLPICSPTGNAGTTANSPLVTLSNKTLKLNNDKSVSVNIPFVSSEDRSCAASSNDEAVAFHSCNKSVTSPEALKRYENHQLSCPLMAAPILLSPEQNFKNIQHGTAVHTSWAANNQRKMAYERSAQLQKLGCDQERRTIKRESQSKIEDLKKAYFTSLSTSRNSVSQNAKTNNNMLLITSSVLQNNSTSYTSATPENGIDSMKKRESKNHVANPECRRVKPTQQCNDDVKNSIDTQSNLVKTTSYKSRQSKTAIFDWNQVMESPSKPEIDLPNFLVGFEKVSEKKSNSPLDQSSEADATCNSQQCAEFSPAYHTSKSFDDFHRFLGRGLSPTLPIAPKFPNLRNTTVGPVIPSIESIDEASISRLPMRPRNQHSMSLATTNPKAYATIPGSSSEIGLSESYGRRAMVSSWLQQSPQTQYTQDNNDGNRSKEYILFGEKPKTTLDHHSTSDLHKIVPKFDPNQLQKQDSISDFPLEGMTFEDFETLTSCPHTSTESCSKLRCGTTSEQSNNSGDPKARVGGRLLSDNLNGLQKNESSQGKKRKSNSLVQLAGLRESIGF